MINPLSNLKCHVPRKSSNYLTLIEFVFKVIFMQVLSDNIYKNTYFLKIETL